MRREPVQRLMNLRVLLGVVGFLGLGFTSLCATVANAAEKPNILWITSEDNGIFWVGCYGGTNAKTPSIDRLAEDGFRYLHCFDNAAVCAPTRSCWITGMYAISNGTQPMRSRNEIPHDKIPYYPDLLRKAGYHTSNPGKTDYNIGGRPDGDCWDCTRDRYAWRKRQPGQPFFAVFNYTGCHESGISDDEKYERVTRGGMRHSRDMVAETLPT